MHWHIFHQLHCVTYRKQDINMLRYNSPFLEVSPADSWKAFVEIR